MRIVKNEIMGFVSSNVTESETLWLATDLYNTLDERRYGHYMYVYSGLNGTNSATNPSIATDVWVKKSPTNYWAMLDGITSTQTSRADNITVEIATNNFDTLSLLEVEAKSIILTLTVADTVVYTQTYYLQNESEVVDFFSYCFSDFIFKTSMYSQDIPLYLGGTLKIEIINPGLTAKCGRLVCGRSLYVGESKYGASLGLDSFSVKQKDEFGIETLVHRGAVNLDNYSIKIPTQKIPVLKKKMIEFDAIPLLFVFDESVNSKTEHLLNYGYYQNMSILLSNPVASTISLTVKGIL